MSTTTTTTTTAPAPVLTNGFTSNNNYKGVDEKSIIEKSGLKYVEPINRSLIINEVQLATKDDRKFYVIKCDDAITDQPLDCLISTHHYDSFGFSELLPIGRHSGKVLKCKGIQGDLQTGYYDKNSGAVKNYWKTAFFIVEPRSEITEKELTEKRMLENELILFIRKLERMIGHKYDPKNPDDKADFIALSK